MAHGRKLRSELIGGGNVNDVPNTRGYPCEVP